MQTHLSAKVCLTFAEKNRHGKPEKCPNTHSFPQGHLAMREWHRMRRYCINTTRLDCWIHGYTCLVMAVYMCSQNVCSLDDSLLPSSLWPAGRRMLGTRDLCCSFNHPPRQLLRWRLACKDCYCSWLSLYLLAISALLCSVAVSGVMLPTVPVLCRRQSNRYRMTRKWPCTHRLAGPAGQARVVQQEHLLLQWNTSALGLHHATYARLRVSLYMRSQYVL